MSHLIASKIARQGRALAVLMLAVGALVLLLAAWGGLSAVEARGAAIDGQDRNDFSLSSTSLASYSLYLPWMSKTDVVYEDNFSNSASGWPHKVKYQDCYFEYRTYGDNHEPVYYMKISSKGQECMVPNLTNPPYSVNGTFSVRVRRISSDSRPLLYGFAFGASEDALEDRWALEVYPNDDPKCENKPFFWLYALQDGDRKYFRDECTDEIDTEKEDENELKIVRNGKNIDVYIDGHHEGDYNDANYLTSEGYVLLRATSASDSDVEIVFDDLKITTSTQAP
jgi:hypothetical protein